jgi:hypothetical protein
MVLSLGIGLARIWKWVCAVVGAPWIGRVAELLEDRSGGRSGSCSTPNELAAFCLSGLQWLSELGTVVSAGRNVAVSPSSFSTMIF